MPKTLINTGKSNDDIARKHLDNEEKEKAREKRNLQRKLDNSFVSRASGLVYASNNDVYFYIDGKNDLLITKRKQPINALCYHAQAGLIFDAGQSKQVIDTELGEVHAKREQPINALCVHKNYLIDGSDAVYQTFKLGSTKLSKLAEFDADITALYSNDEKIYCGTLNGDIYEIDFNPEKAHLTKRELPILSICEHDDVLLDTDGNNIYDTILGKTVSLERLGVIAALCSINGHLIDGGDYGIRDITTGKHLMKRPVSAMCNLPSEVSEKYWRRYENERTNK